MLRAIGLCVLSFFVLQFACGEMRIGRAAYCAENDAIDPKEWDFGQVQQGEVAKHDFLFKNETADVLKIININTSCGCTASQSDKQSLLPGETTTISVSFNSHGYSGEVKQFVYLNTDNPDPDLAIVRFIVKAQVVKK
jgi:hypothetical protein